MSALQRTPKANLIGVRYLGPLAQLCMTDDDESYHDSGGDSSSDLPVVEPVDLDNYQVRYYQREFEVIQRRKRSKARMSLLLGALPSMRYASKPRANCSC